MLTSMHSMTPAQLRQLRAKLNLTQEELATILEVDRRTVVRWEKGDVPISDRIETWIKAVLLRRGHILTIKVAIISALSIIAHLIDL
jgi:DNA-binding XRE family transcriptional regulator